MKMTLSLIALSASILNALGGSGDVINYAPPQPTTEVRVIVAEDGRRTEPRWQAMLDDKDLRRLEFIRARNTLVIVHELR